jgi:hypothetical protein
MGVEALNGKRFRQKKQENKKNLGGIEMAMLLIGTALLGLVLGRFFKVFVLIPTCCFALVLAFAGPTLGYESLTYSFVEIALIIASLQIGYFIALASRDLLSDYESHSIWASSQRHTGSRSLHLR